MSSVPTPAMAAHATASSSSMMIGLWPRMIEEVVASDLQPTDVLVRIGASGLCHTDLEVIEGQLAYPLPIVLGHEGCGIVERVGSAVLSAKPGDKVVCSWNPNCGHCF